ncbi:MAG: SOS response-associated peptidase [Gemmatimonadaceae bacterium]
MCGRSSLHDVPTNVLDRFRLPPVLPGFTPRFNIAPTQEQWTIAVGRDRKPVSKLMRWGLVPSWSKDRSAGHRMFNARAESVTEKPAFRDAMQRRRCPILADGYYEWSVRGKSKVPMYFYLAGNRAFAMAGLWEFWNDGDAPLLTCAVITTPAGARTQPWHHRMPAILTLDGAESWLDASTPPSALQALLVPYDQDDLVSHEVAKLVNSPANDRAECMAPLVAEAATVT